PAESHLQNVDEGQDRAHLHDKHHGVLPLDVWAQHHERPFQGRQGRRAVEEGFHSSSTHLGLVCGRRGIRSIPVGLHPAIQSRYFSLHICLHLLTPFFSRRTV